MKKKFYPLCYKCENGLWAKTKGASIVDKRLNPEEFKGCREDSRVTQKNFETMCPLLKRKS